MVSTTARSDRFQELLDRYAQLEPRLSQGPVKEALATLHAMIQEVGLAQALPPAHDGSDGKLQELLTYHKTAPAMEGEALSAGLPVGTKAPDFTLPDSNGEPIRLSDFRGQPLVLVFYPLDWSPACSDQLSLYQQELAAFEQRGAQLLAVSVDSIYSHGAWSLLRGLTFPLLSDFEPKGELARQYGVYRETQGFSERALYVIDSEGVIQYAHVSPYLHHIPDIYELFEALEALEAEPRGEPQEVAV